MPLTKKMSREALSHVLQVVMDEEEEGPIQQALKESGRDKIFDLISITVDEIRELQYTDDEGKERILGGGNTGMIFAFRGFIHHKASIGQRILDEDWTKITREAFDEYRSGPAFLAYQDGGVPAAAALPSQRTRDPVSEFKKGIKRDISYFPTLKEDKQWDTWYRATEAQARLQDVSEVLDENYTAVDTVSKSLFNEKQKYMYAAFERTLLNDKGKALVRAHSQDYDAQTIYRELRAYALLSTKASLDSTMLLSYITSARLGDGKWRGSTHAFILHWQDQVRKYEDLVPHGDHFSEGQKRTLLENGVFQIAELRAVKSQAAQHKTQTGQDLTYLQYCALLTSAALQYDRQFDTPSSNKPRPRSVYEHHLQDEQYPGDESYHIDSDLDIIEAYAASTRFRHGPRLNRDQWQRLSPEARTTWDLLPDDAKHVILESKMTRPPVPLKPHVPPHLAEPFQAQIHDIQPDTDLTTTLASSNSDAHHEDPKHGHNSTDDDKLLAHLTKRTTLPPGDISRVLSSSMSRNQRNETSDPASNHDEITLNGSTYRKINRANILYSTWSHRTATTKAGALIDRGANGGIAGADVRVIHKTGKQVDIQGIDNHQVVDIPIVTAGAVVQTQRGEVIAIMNQYAWTRKGKTIHSCAQMEWYKQDVNDKSIKVHGGKQRILTNDGYAIPLNIRSGLPYMTMRPFTDREWDTLPHVMLTGDSEWNPSVLDHSIDDDDEWYDAVSELPDDPTTLNFDLQGDYRHRYTITETNVHDPNTTADLMHTSQYSVYARHITPRTPNYDDYRPRFGWLDSDIIRRTFDATTQHARIPMSTILKKHYKSPYPANNVTRRDEPVATDTVYSDTPSVDSGCTSAQFFVGTESLVCDVYGMKTDKQFVNTLEDNIRRRGAPTKLISDRAQVEISNRVQDMLRALAIGDWQSEPHQQHQNPAERKYQQVKRMTNTILDRTGSPASTWLLAMRYICFLLNYTASALLGWRTPMERLTGSTPDISPLLRFHWWEPLYYKLDDSDFPSESRELRGRFVGISEHVGHAMTYTILTDDTTKLIHRSNIRSAATSTDRNLRLDMAVGESSTGSTPQIVNSIKDDTGHTGGNPHAQLHVVDPSTLIGRTFLTQPFEDGQRHRARIVEAIHNHEQDRHTNPDHLRFLCSFNNDAYEEIVSYNDIIAHIEKDEEDTTVWKFRRITAHEGPLHRHQQQWRGSSYNVMVEWENGEITSEPLSIVAADDPVSSAIYAREQNLLDTPGWKRFKTIAKRQKKLFRMANQARLRSYRTAPRFQYGFEVPRDYDHAIDLDKRNGNTKWQDATNLEFSQLDDYQTFTDLGTGSTTPPGYKKIRVHLVFAVKHDGRHKVRCVADGHLTDIPVDSVYSGVVSLRGLRMLIFLAELNGLETWATDIGNAYLEATTEEKVYIIAGPEFGERAGHTLLIHKALYGLRSSGLRWHERFSDVLRDLGFSPCRAEPDIWMRSTGTKYEYVAVYVDDLAMAMEDPQSFINTLTDKHKFKLKGTGTISFHLGCDFFRDDDGVLCMAPKKYIEKIAMNYENMFGTRPKQTYHSPLEKGDHPELDNSELLDPNDVQKYQSLIGSLQWVISLGRFDIATAVMSLSSFRAAPRRGHLERARRICGYLVRMKHGIIRFRTDEPDYSDIPSKDYDCQHSVYGNVREMIPDDAPPPLGKSVTMTHYVDANLFHNLLTGRSVTGILHLLNQCPIDWFSKKQATVETATYGSEFVAARTCVEQILDLRTTLRYLGVPIREKSFMFGDNESVVNSSANMQSKLHKRHTALSYHRVREAIAAGVVGFFQISGELNPADILSKHWGYAVVWPLMRPLLFWKGDTARLACTNDERACPADNTSNGETNCADRDHKDEDNATTDEPTKQLVPNR